jgi:4-alpha-glucanotransferase
MSRSSGILLHPTSLPGAYGIGDLGPAAYRFVDELVAARQTYWQVLPLGPTSYGDSPYQTFSAFAGNPLLVSPELLVRDGLLDRAALRDVPALPAGKVDYGPVILFKQRLLAQALAHFEAHAPAGLGAEIERFAAEQSSWLADFALFMALKDAYGGRPWPEWDREIAARQPAALAHRRSQLAAGIRLHTYGQFLFFRQWMALKRYANKRGVRLIGDAPIFVAHDSADCWARPELFYLQADGRPSVVAGVPPDYFSATGQLWGNPLYRWDVQAATGYAWWIARLRTVLSLVDVLRLDHFRGFSAYWQVPATARTAEKGSWERGPGAALFAAAQEALGSLPIIAEDLGVITPDVETLRDHFGFPGMKILQFAFGSGADNPYLPHNYTRSCVVYTGTHDNDTTTGWFASATEKVRAHTLGYTGAHGKEDVVWALVRLALASAADTAVVPLQDLLGLGSAARMNQPGTRGGNWSWRYAEGTITPELIERLAALTVLFGRAREEKASGKEQARLTVTSG